jgi:hypothetical protein
MGIWILAVVLAVLAAVGFRQWYRAWRRRRVAARRIVEKPNSFYSSVLVKNQVDRQRWGRVDLSRLHPVNREEVERLLAVADVQGLDALSPKERLFLENMTRVSFG